MEKAAADAEWGAERSEVPREGSALERAARWRLAHNAAAFSNPAAFPIFADAAVVMPCFCAPARRSDFACGKTLRAAIFCVSALHRPCRFADMEKAAADAEWGAERSEVPREGSALERAARWRLAHNAAAFSIHAAFPTFADAAVVMPCFCIPTRRSDFAFGKTLRAAIFCVSALHRPRQFTDMEKAAADAEWGAERSEVPREGSALERAARWRLAHNAAAFSNPAAFPTFADAAVVMPCFCAPTRRSDFACGKIASARLRRPPAFACGKSRARRASHKQKIPPSHRQRDFAVFSYYLTVLPLGMSPSRNTTRTSSPASQASSIPSLISPQSFAGARFATKMIFFPMRSSGL